MNLPDVFHIKVTRILIFVTALLIIFSHFYPWMQIFVWFFGMITAKCVLVVLEMVEEAAVKAKDSSESPTL